MKDRSSPRCPTRSRPRSRRTSSLLSASDGAWVHFALGFSEILGYYLRISNCSDDDRYSTASLPVFSKKILEDAQDLTHPKSTRSTDAPRSIHEAFVHSLFRYPNPWTPRAMKYSRTARCLSGNRRAIFEMGSGAGRSRREHPSSEG